MSKKVPLGQAHHALVDDDDYPRLANLSWFLSGPGYAVGFMRHDGKYRLVYMHRLILDAQPGELVDHINGNPLDNRRANLRLATSQQNSGNKRVSSLSTTGLKGVSYHRERRKYHTRIQYQGIRYHLGFFTDAETAALTYDAAARTLFGEFALCNYPDKETPQCVAAAVRERLRGRGYKLA